MTETVVTVENAPNNNAAKTGVGNEGGGGGGGGGLAWLKVNVDYFRTLPGIVKIVQLVLGIICMACASPAYFPGTHWFLFAVTISFISTLIWSFVYLLSVREALNLPIDWLLSEMVNTGCETVLYCIGFIVQLAVWVSPNHILRVANLIAGVFGILNTIAYGYGTLLLHREWKSSRSTN